MCIDLFFKKKVIETLSNKTCGILLEKSFQQNWAFFPELRVFNRVSPDLY